MFVGTAAAGTARTERACAPSLLIQAHDLTQKLIALAQHLGARVRVLELMIQIVPRDQLVFHAGFAQALGHQPGLPDGDREGIPLFLFVW